MMMMIMMMMQCVQTMNILIVNQSIVDTLASLFSALVVDSSISGLAHGRFSDQLLCRIWLTRKPLWSMMVLSTYSILLMTLSRYLAVIYPIRYKNVRLTIDK